jgi:heme A synthase
MQSVPDPEHGAREETKRLLVLLITGSLVIAVLLLWFATSALGAPLVVGVFVVLFFLCLAAIVISMVWYVEAQRRR